MNANAKCEFAELKYQQLLNDKYFVETCFSKKFDSYSQKERLRDIIFFMNNGESCSYTSEGIESSCLI